MLSENTKSPYPIITVTKTKFEQSKIGKNRPNSIYKVVGIAPYHFRPTESTSAYQDYKQYLHNEVASLITREVKLRAIKNKAVI